MQLPKIIHQIWSGVKEPLPERFRVLGETWKEHYPSWEYIFWDNEKMNRFILNSYPQCWDIYNKYPFNVQRWDAIRYLILYKIGGMYVDFDYESIKPLDELLEEKTCCFALEPQSYCFMFKKRIMFNNALMFSTPGHPFMKKIIDAVFSENMLKYDTSSKNNCVLNTTGPWTLIDLYNNLSSKEKEDIYLIPSKYVTPFDGFQSYLFLKGEMGPDLENCLEEAYAVHYYFSGWRADND